MAPRHLLHIFPTFETGGQQVRFALIANKLGRRYRHTIVALDSRFDCAARLSDEVDYHLLDLHIDKSRPFRNLLTFRQQIRTLAPDLLLTYNWGAIEWALVNRYLPICGHVHFEDGFHPDEAIAQKRRRIWARRLALGGSRCVVVPSRTLERIALEIWQLPTELVRYIPNGVDCAHFHPDFDRAQPAAANRSPILGTVATLRAEKNIGRLMRVFARLRRQNPLRLVIAGDGPERTTLVEQAHQLGLSEDITFCGQISDPADVLRSFSVFVLSSDTEQMPMSILEAMATGLPIAATNVGDVREMLAQENLAYVVARDDEDALANAIAGILANPAGADAMGAGNRARAAADFSQQHMLDEYDRLFSL